MTNVKHQQGRWERKRGEQSWEKIFQLNTGACLTPEILPEYQKGCFLKRPKPPNEEDVCKLEGGKWAVKLAQERAEAGRGGGLEGGPQEAQELEVRSLCRQVGLDGKSLQEAVGPLHCCSQFGVQAPVPHVGRRVDRVNWGTLALATPGTWQRGKNRGNNERLHSYQWGPRPTASPNLGRRPETSSPGKSSQPERKAPQTPRSGRPVRRPSPTTAQGFPLAFLGRLTNREGRRRSPDT